MTLYNSVHSANGLSGAFKLFWLMHKVAFNALKPDISTNVLFINLALRFSSQDHDIKKIKIIANINHNTYSIICEELFYIQRYLCS